MILSSRVRQRLRKYLARSRRRSGRHDRRVTQSLLVEALEPRIVLATVSLSGGELLIDETGFQDDNLTIATSGDGLSVLVTDPGGVTAGTGATQVNSTTVTAPLAGITSRLKVDTSIGTDTVTFQSLDLGTASIEAKAGIETINVSAAATLAAAGGIDLGASDTLTIDDDAVVSARHIAAGGDPATATSTGDSGALTLFGLTITVDPGATLLAQADSGFTAGAISLSADTSSTAVPIIPSIELTDVTITIGGSGAPTSIRGGGVTIATSITNDISSPFRQIGVTDQTAKITVQNTTIEGDSVSVTSTSQDKNKLSDLPAWSTNYLIDPGFEALRGVLPSMPFGVQVRAATATVNLDGATVTSTGNVTITSGTTVNSSLEAVAARSLLTPTKLQQFNVLSAGYAQAKGTSETTLTGTTTIVADGTVTIGTKATTAAKASARTTANIDASAPANPKAVALSFGIARTVTDSLTTIDEGVSITSKGNVNVTSSGNVTTSGKSSASAYVDGLFGLSGSLALDTTNIKTIVDGQISAVGDTVVRDVQIANVGTNTMTIPNHGFQTGDTVEYFARDPMNPGVALEPIGGLLSGEVLNVIVLDSDTIQLSRTKAIEIDTAGVNPSATQTFSRRETVTFDPQTAVDPTTNTFTLDNHGFTTGQSLTYLVGSSEDDPIGGLLDQGVYFAIVTSPATFELAETEEDALSGAAIDITSQGVGSAQLFGFDEAPKSFDPATDVDPATGTFTIANHGFITGDSLVYAVDPTIETTVPISRFAAFSPQDQTNTFDPTGEFDTGDFVLNLGDGTIAVTNHGFDNGDEVVYSTNGGEPIGGLSNGGTYYVIKANDSLLLLAASASDADNAVAITLEGGATLDMDQPHTLTATGGAADSISFDPLGDYIEPVVDTVADTILITPVHNYVTGQRVTYSTGGGSAIGGLTDGADYYVINIAPNELQLAATRAAALAGTSLAISSGAAGTSHSFTSNQVDIVDNLIITPGHDLETGQRITYVPGDESPIGNLASNTEYVAIRLDENTIQIANSVANAAAGSGIDLAAGATGMQQQFQSDGFVTTLAAGRLTPVVDTTTWTIEIPDHQLQIGDEVNYQSSGGDPIGGLGNDTNYYVIPIDADRIQLAATAEDAMNATPIALAAGASIGSGLHTLRVIPFVEIAVIPDRLLSFDPTAVPPVDTTNDTILLVNHGFSDGDAVTYLTGGGTPIGGLDNGTEYYVLVVSDDLIQLAATAGGPALPLGSGATGTMHGLERESTATQGDIPIGGLSDAERFFAIVIDENTFQLQESNQDALAAEPITFDASQATGTTHELVPVGEGAGVFLDSTLKASNTASAGSSLGSSPSIKDLLTKGELQTSFFNWKAYFKDGVKDQFKYVNGDKNQGTGSNGNSAFSFSGSFGWNQFDHTVLTQVGKPAVLTSSADVSVTAAVSSQKVQLKGQGNVDPDSGRKAGLGVAVSVGFYSNTVQAIVDGDGTDGATIDAAGDVTVSSNLAYPLLVTPITLAPFSSFFPDGKWDPSESDAISDIASFLDGSLGLSRIFNVFSTVKVNTSKSANLPKVAISGTVAYTDFTNVSEAIIRGGARINQSQPLQNDDQSVSVNAGTGMQLVQLSGIMHLKLNEAAIAKSFKNKDNLFDAAGNFFSFFGNKSSTFGFGGSAVATVVDNTTIARIEDAAAVHTGSNGGLTVDAVEDVNSFTFAQSGGSSGNIGISASIAYIEQTSTTLAHLESGVQVSGGSLQATADSQLTHINVAGAAQIGKRLGIGIAIAIPDVDRTTAAIIGNRRTDDDSSIGDAGTVLDVDSITMSATASGKVWSFALVGAMVSNVPLGTAAPQQANAGPVMSTSGVALAGGVSWNTVDDTTQAYLNDDGTVRSGDISLAADNSTGIMSATGAATFASKSDQTLGGSLAGSFSYNQLKLTTESFVIGTDIAAADNVMLTATTTPQLLVIAAGFAGAVAKSTLTISGSMSWNDITNTVRAYLDQVQVDPSGFVKLTATDASQIEADGGGFSIGIARANDGQGGSIAVGVAAAVNNITDTVQSYLNATTVTNASSVSLDAEATATIKAYTWAGSLAGGASGMAGLAGSGAGAGSGNAVTANVEAAIKDSSDVSVGAGGVNLTATNQLTIDSNAGGVALAVEANGTTNVAVAIGAAAATNSIENGTTNAVIDSSQVTSSGAVKLDSSSTGSINAVSVAVSIGATMGGSGAGIVLDGAGAGSGNFIHNNATAAAITGGSHVTTTGGADVSLEGAETSTITAIAPAVELGFASSQGTSFSLSIGIAITNNDIANTLQATVNDATVDAAGKLSLTTDNTQSKIDTTAVAITGNLTLSDKSSIALTGVGAQAVNKIKNTIEASLTGGSMVSGAAGVSLDATDKATISAGVSAASLQAAIGDMPSLSLGVNVSLAENNIGDDNGHNSVRAVIDNATVAQSSSLSATATSTPSIDVTSVAVGVAITGSQGVSAAISAGGANAVNSILNTVEAAILNGSNVTTTTGDVRLTATENSPAEDKNIRAEVVTATIAVAVGQNPSGAIDIAAAVARNMIGKENDPGIVSATIDNASVHSAGAIDLSADSSATINSKSAAVAVAAGISEGGSIGGAGAGATSTNDIYNTIEAVIRNVPADANGDPLVTSGGNVSLDATDASDILGNAGGGSLGVSVGQSFAGSVAIGVALATNTISNDVQAQIDNATVDSGGSVSLSADSTATINSVTAVVSISAAVSANGSLAGVGDGAHSTNNIGGTVEAAILNSSSVTADGGGVSLTATDDATITADSGIGDLGVAVSSSSFAGSLAIGVILSDNTINTTVAANIVDSNVQTSGDVQLAADSTADVTALTVVVTINVAIASGVGVTLTGNGSHSTNMIQGTVQATISGVGEVTTTGGGHVSASATDTSTITARSGEGSLSVGGGSGGGGSITVAVVLADNTISKTVQSYIDGTRIDASGDVAISTQSTPTINSTTGTVDIAITASGGAAGSLTIGVTQATNTISNTVSSYIANAVVDAEGRTSVTSTTTSTIDATSFSAALSGAISEASLALTTNTSKADNTSDSTIEAYIGGGSDVTAAGNIDVTATDTSTLTASNTSGSISIGVTGGSLAISLGDNQFQDKVHAYIDSSDVTSTSGNISVAATANPNLTTNGVTFAVTVAIGASGFGANSTADVNGEVLGYVGGTAHLVADNGTVDVQANSTASANTTVTGGGGSILSVAGIESFSTIDQSLQSYVTGSAIIEAGGLSVIANSIQAHATANTTVGSVGLVTGQGGNSTAKVLGDVTAYVGPAAGATPPATAVMVVLGNGAATVQAMSQDAKAEADSSGGGGGGVSVTVMLPTATVSTDTSAAVGEGASIRAAGLTVEADTTYTADATSTVVDIASYTGSGVNASATVDGTSAAFIGPAQGTTPTATATTIMLTSGDASVNASMDATGTTDVTVGAGSIVASGAGTVVNATVTPATRAYLGERTKVTTSGDVTVAADTILLATSTSFGLVVSGGLGGAGTGTTTTAEPTIETYAASDSEVTAGNVTFQVRLNVGDDGKSLTGKMAKADGTVGAGAVFAGAAGANVQGTFSPTIDNYLAQNATITAAGSVTFLTQTYQYADVVASSVDAAGGVGVGVTLVTGNAKGTTETYVDGQIASASSVSISSQVLAQVDANGEANGGALLADGNGTNVQATLGDAGFVETYVGSHGQINATGNVDISSVVATKASSTSGGVTASAGISVGSMPATVSIQPEIDAYAADGAMIQSSNGGIALLAAHNYDPVEQKFLTDNKAFVTSTILTISLGLSVADTTITANANSDVEARGESGAALLAPAGSVSVVTRSSNWADGTIDNRGGAAISYSGGTLDANAKGTTSAQLLSTVAGASNTPGANSVVVTAQASDITSTDLTQSSGGVVSVTDATVNSTTSPTVSAQLGGTIRATGSVTLQTNSFTDADGTIRGGSGGVVNVTNYNANATNTPTASASVLDNAAITSGGGVTVSTLQGIPPTPLSDGTFDAATQVDPSQNTISFDDDHGLSNGDTIVYDAKDNPVISGLVADRQYAVIVDGAKSLKLGDVFSASSSTVDLVNDTIVFPFPHGLEGNGQPATSDHVVYNVPTGGTAIGGLTSGTNYYVQVVNDETLRLVDPNHVPATPPTTFAGSDVDLMDLMTINLPGNPFVENQAITYAAAQPLGFSIAVVNINVVNDQPVPDPAANNVYVGADAIAAQGFVDGDTVVYMASDPAQAIPMLTSGERYLVKLDASKPDQLQLADANNVSMIIPLDTTGLDSNVTHSLVKVADLPIGGLNDQQTYYVVNRMDDSIQLAEAPGGMPVTLDPFDPANPMEVLTGTRNQLAELSVDLSGTGSGVQQIIVDLLAAASGTQQLVGVGGALSFAKAPSGDGIVTTSVNGGSGGAIDVSNANTDARSNPIVSTVIGQAAEINAGGDVSVTSSSFANISTSATNGNGGFVAVGTADAEGSANNQSTTSVASQAQINAGGNVTITSRTSEQGTGSTNMDGGGFVDFATAKTTVKIDYASQVNINSNATVSAGGELMVASTSDLSGTTSATANSSGLGGNADANNSSSRGLLIGNSSALTQTTINSNAHLQGATVVVAANVTSMDAYSSSTSKASAFGADSKARGTVHVNDRSEVLLQSGSRISGDDVTIEALHNGIDVTSYANAKCSCFGGVSDATADTDYQSHSQVTANQGALLEVKTLTVRADQNVSDYDRSPHRSGAFLDFGSSHSRGSYNAHRDIFWEATVNTLGQDINPNLLVDANGVVQIADNVTLNGGTVQQGDTYLPTDTIIVDDIVNPPNGQTLFTANALGSMDGNSPPQGTITGTHGQFNYHDTFDSATLVNQSASDLQINGITVYSPPMSNPEITIEVQVDSSFQFDVVETLPATDVQIENAHASAAPLLSLGGLIDNPIGTTTISSASGDVIATRPVSASDPYPTTVRTNTLVVDATLGSVGRTSTSSADEHRVNAQMVQTTDPSFPDTANAYLTVDAGQDVVFSDQALLRQTTSESPPAVLDSHINRIAAGHDADLRLLEGLRQTTATTTASIRVSETSRVVSFPSIPVPPASSNQPPRVTTVVSHWPPSSSGSISVNPGLDAGGAGSPISTTYDFSATFTDLATMASETRRVEAGNDIDIQECANSACDSGTVNVLGNVDLTGDTNGRVTTITDGFIDLTEVVVAGTNRALRVATIQSTASSVLLTVPDTAALGEDLTLFNAAGGLPGGSLIGAATTVTLHVGDNMLAQGDILGGDVSRIEAGTTILIHGDYLNADLGVGSVLDLRGTITGNLAGTITSPTALEMVAQITTEDDADIVSLTNVTTGTGTTVTTNEQNDTIQAGSNAQVGIGSDPPTSWSPTNTGGVLHRVLDLLTFDGGAGDDFLSADDSGDPDPDSGVLTYQSITGFQMTAGILYLDIEQLVITLGQAADTLDVDSTNATTVSQVFGNAGNDTVSVAKLASPPVLAPSCPVNPSATNTADTVDCILGYLQVFGGDDYDFLNVIDIGQTDARSGMLTDTTVAGLNMGPQGIQYLATEAVDITLGQAVDTFVVQSTAAPQANGNTTISAVHGGGGSDLLTVTGGGGPDSPLVIYGDFTSTGTPGADTIDASTSSAGVMVDGNEGNDLVTGSQGADSLAGSAGDDMILGLAGNDNLIGDSGFEVDLLSRITTIITTHAPGGDLLQGDDGNDILFGDHAILTPLAGIRLVEQATNLVSVETANESVGGADVVHGNADNDIAFGGQGDDLVFGDAGDDNVLGDNGRFAFQATLDDVLLTFTPRPLFGGNDNAFGDSGNNTDPDGADILYDGPADDELDGGPGDDVFRLTPGDPNFAAGSRDWLSDIRGSDTVDFTFAQLRADCTSPATATDLCGIMIDMDLLGYTDQAFSQFGPANRNPITDDAPQQVPQDPAVVDWVTLLRVSDFSMDGYAQSPVTPSPFENVVGSIFNDTIWIQALSTGGDVPQNGPPVLRNVNGNAPVVGDAAVPPGDKLYFNAEGHEVVDTGFSLTALGIGTVTYQSIEELCSFHQAPRIIDNDDDFFEANPNTAVPNINYYQNWNFATGLGFNSDYLFDVGRFPGDSTEWQFHGVTPGNYRVSVTFPDNANNANLPDIASEAPFTVIDQDYSIATIDVDQQLAPRDFSDQGVFWNDLGVFSIESHSLIVELTNLADGIVQADAVRIERVAEGPSLRLRAVADRLEVLSDVTRLELQTTLGAPVTRSFQVFNQGDEDLVITGIGLDPLSAPNWSITPPPVGSVIYPLTLEPGASTSFQVTLTADPSLGFGQFPAGVQIFSNDPLHNIPRKLAGGGMTVDPFEFAVRGTVETVLIETPTDANYSLFGVWAGGAAGYQDDAFVTKGDGRGNRAMWTFSDLPAGEYRVSTTFVPAPTLGASTAAPFRVSDASAVLGNVTVNQAVAPNDFFADGANWEDLGGPYTVTNGELVVELLDTTGQSNVIVIADTVRIERLVGDQPGIQVTVDSQTIDDAKGVVDFGTDVPGRHVTKTFTVSNNGGSPLTISEPTVPPGFTLVSFAGQQPTGSLTATAPTTFEIRLDAGYAGALTGEVSFATNDPVNDPFHFLVTANVPSSLIIDDQDPTGFTATPGFTLFANNAQGYHERVHHADANNSGDTATWTFDNLAEGGTYIVSATWSPDSTRAVHAPFVVSGVSDGPTMVLVNQQRTPSDRTANGTVWEDLGTFTVADGTTLTVALTDDAEGIVIADAVRIQPLQNPQIVVAKQHVQLQNGESSIDFGSAPLSAGMAVERSVTVTNQGARDMALDVTLPDGFVLAGSFPDSLPAGDSATLTVAMSQDVAGSYRGELRIDNDDVHANPFVLTLLGNVLGTGVVLDDNAPAPAFTQSGFSPFTATGYQARVLAAPAGDGSAFATWQFSGLTPGLYRVAATWPTHPNRATNSPFSVYDGDTTTGTLLGTARIDQRDTPGDFIDQMIPWQDVLTVRISGDTLSVQLTNDANGYVIADAIRIERLDEQPRVALLDSTGNAIAAESVFDFGSVDPGETRTETFTLVNFGSSALTLEPRLPLDFVFVTAPPATLAANASASFEVRFQPTRVDTYSGDLRLSNNTSNQNPFDVILTGKVTPDEQIIDVLDPGYADTGFTTFTGQGFAGQVRESTPDAGNVATWTFAGVQPDTTYRVSATWPGYSNRATNAPFSISEIAGGTTTYLVNQRLEPGDYNADGAAWQDLGIVRTTGSTLTVQLSDLDANGVVIADAIRIEELPFHGPEIQVTLDGLDLPHATSEVDFGTTTLGVPVLRTLTITSMGTVPLVLDPVLELPAGFSLSSADPPTLFDGATFTTVPPGDSVTFTVQLDAASTGMFVGTLSFDVNEIDENPFQLTVRGSEVDDSTLIDNDQPGYSQSGPWSLWTNQGFNNNVREIAPGANLGTATYTFDGLTPGDVYLVAATWTAYSNRATDVPYTIHGGTQGSHTVTLNQRLSPDSFVDEDFPWEDVTTVTVDSGGMIAVDIGSSTTGNVIADAVQIRKLTGPEIVVRVGETTIVDGTTTVDFGRVLAGGMSSRVFTVSNVGVADLILQPVVVPIGFQLVGSNFTPGQVVAPGGSATFELQLDTSSTGVVNGFVSFGSNDRDESPFNFPVTGIVDTSRIIDNKDADFSAPTGFSFYGGQGYENSVVAKVGANAGNTATWTFSDLLPGTYRVSATWSVYFNRATNAPFSINGGDPVLINQQLTPNNPAYTSILDSGFWFADLSTDATPINGVITVTLSDANINGWIVADAIRIAEITSSPISSLSAEGEGQVQAMGQSESLVITGGISVVPPRYSLTHDVLRPSATDDWYHELGSRQESGSDEPDAGVPWSSLATIVAAPDRRATRASLDEEPGALEPLPALDKVFADWP